ncbi:PAS domain-containing protein [bacterium]|nr:PAS domain-containing protein [bacterium]
MGTGEKRLINEIRKLRAELKELFRAEKERLELEALLCSRTTELIKANEMLLAEVAARENAEKSLCEYQYVYRKLLDFISEAVFVADAGSGVIINANRAAGALIGRSVDEIAGMHQTRLHPPEESQHYSAMFRKAVEGAAGQLQNVVLLHSSGRSIATEVSTFTFFLGGKALILGVFREVSRPKGAQSERERLNLLLDELSRRLSAPSRGGLDLQ